MPKNTTIRLVEQWREAGINQGDTLLLHCSIRRTLLLARESGHDLSPSALLETFLQAIGTTGTLLLPLFNFDFTKGITFDIRSTPSQMGVLTEAGRNHPSAIRTGHPIYSFAVIGAKSNELRGLNNFSGYGEDSPFGFIHRNYGKIAILDLPEQNSMTFYHYVEEMLRVPYRYHKKFSGSYIDEQGRISEQSCGLFVRDIENGVKTYVNPMGNLLWKRGLYRGSLPCEGSGLRVIGAKDIFDATAEVIREGRAFGVLYNIER
jgi:aminoglycoside 3-N-acetyltransferase